MLGWILISWGKKLPDQSLFSIWAARYFSQDLRYWKSYRDRGYLISFFYHQFRLPSWARSELPPLIMSTVILHSRENIKFREERFCEQQVLVEHICLTLLQHQNFEHTCFCYLRDPEDQSSNLLHRQGWWNDETTGLVLHWKRGTQMWKIPAWLFSNAAILLVLEVQVNANFHQVWQVLLQ